MGALKERLIEWSESIELESEKVCWDVFSAITRLEEIEEEIRKTKQNLRSILGIEERMNP